jgi:cell division septation protein DedD
MLAQATSEDKYTQLVKENRVLMSTTIVVVILLAPAFTLGYVQGKRSAQPLGTISATTTGAEAGENTKQATPSKSSLPPNTHKSANTALPGSKETPAASAEAGSRQVYLQIAAGLGDQSARVMEELQSKGFPASAKEVPDKPGMTRVLVGPIDEQDLQDIRAELQRQGFPGSSAIKRVF